MHVLCTLSLRFAVTHLQETLLSRLSEDMEQDVSLIIKRGGGEMFKFLVYQGGCIHVHLLACTLLTFMLGRDIGGLPVGCRGYARRKKLWGNALVKETSFGMDLRNSPRQWFSPVITACLHIPTAITNKPTI